MEQLLGVLPMEQLVDGLQLVGFLLVAGTVLAALVAVTIGLAAFLYMTDRQIVVVKNAGFPQSRFWSLRRYLVLKTLD